jgi:transposase
MKKIIIPKSVRYFTDEDKHEVIKDYLSSGLSKDHIWRKYTGKSDHGRLLRWMRDLGYMSQQNQLNRSFASQTNKMPKKNTHPQPVDQDFETLQLKKRIQDLEKQLKEAELKAIAFSTMVDIAEKEFKIPIRKKYNTKP